MQRRLDLWSFSWSSRRSREAQNQRSLRLGTGRSITVPIPAVTSNGHCGVIFGQFSNQIYNWKDLVLIESSIFCFCESDEKRPNGGRSKFADALISRLTEDRGRSTTVSQAIQSTRQTHCFGGINLEKERNEVRRSFYFHFYFSTW